MVNIPVSCEKDKYKPSGYNYLNTSSKMESWVPLEILSGLISGVRQVEKSFHLESGLRSVCNTVKLIKGLEIASLGSEFAWVILGTPKVVFDSLCNLVHCSNKIDSIASLLGETSMVCGAIKFFHRIEAIKLGHLIDGIDLTKYTAGLLACALRIESTRRWINNRKPKDDSKAAKTAHEAKLSAKRWSYWSDGSLGILYLALLASKRMKVNPYVFIVAGLASSLAYAITHFKTARADHAEAQYAYSKIATAA